MDENKLRELAKDPSEDYYLAAFKKLDDTGKNTWNWAAAFGLWFLYRKMFVPVLLYGIAGKIITGIVLLAFSIEPHSDSADVLDIILGVICFIFFGIFGNRIYYERVKKNIQKGCHVCERYRPTSPVALYMFLLWPIMAPIIWFRDKILLSNAMKKCNSLFDDALDEKNIKAAIATKSEDYYVDKFRQIESGKIISLNWASFLGGFGWFFYRKMYLYGSLFLITSVLLFSIPLLLCGNWLFLLALSPTAGCIIMSVGIVASLLPNLLMLLGGANHLYYRHLTKNKV